MRGRVSKYQKGCCQSLLEMAFSRRFQKVYTYPPPLWDDMLPHWSETRHKSSKKCQFAPRRRIMAVPERYATLLRHFHLSAPWSWPFAPLGVCTCGKSDTNVTNAHSHAHFHQCFFRIHTGRDPAGANITMSIVGNIVFCLCRSCGLQPAAFRWHPPCSRARKANLGFGHELALKLLAGRSLTPDVAGLRCPGTPLPCHHDPVVTSKTFPFSNQRLLCCVRGGHGTLRKFTCRHGQ